MKQLNSLSLIIFLCMSISLRAHDAPLENIEQKKSEYFQRAVMLDAETLLPILDNDDDIEGIRAPRPDAESINSAIVGAFLQSTLASQGPGNNFSVSSGGNVRGPSSSTINAVARFANNSGTLLKDSLVLVDDAGNIQINGITKNGNTVSWPSVVGAAGTVLSSDGAGNLVYATPVGSGNVSTAILLLLTMQF